MSEKCTNWSNAFEQYQTRIVSENLLVCVHPTYGRGLVSLVERNKYLDSLQEFWAIVNIPLVRLLVSGGFEDEVFLRYIIEPDIIISTFPDSSNLSGVQSPIIKVCGSTARNNEKLPPGCVDTVAHLLMTNGYGKSVQILPDATFFPQYSK